MVLRSGHILDGSLVVASDVHLREPDDERSRLLLDVIARVGAGVEYFVLNGDIFDFCFGGGGYWRRKFAGLGEALAGLAARGVRVLFVEGNHEFHLDRIGWQGVEVVQERDFLIALKSGTRIKITHGDRLSDDPLYKVFRGLVKSQVAHACAHFIPGSWLDAYALKHSKVSRSHDKYRRLDHERILGAFNRWLGSGEADHGIIGHYHVPYAEKRETHDGLMLSVESWDRPNLLVFADGGFHRVFLGDPGAAFRMEPVESLFRDRPR